MAQRLAPSLSAITRDIIASVNQALASCWGRGGWICLLLVLLMISSALQDFHHSRWHCIWGQMLTMPDDDIMSQYSLGPMVPSSPRMHHNCAIILFQDLP